MIEDYPVVRVYKNDIDAALREFRRKCELAGIAQRKRRHFGDDMKVRKYRVRER